MKSLMVFFCFISFLFFHTQIVYAGKLVNSKYLEKEDVQTAILSVVWGGIRTDSNIIALADIDQSTVTVIDIHQEGNTALVYCNFINKKGEKLFGYIPLIRLAKSLIWVNRDNWTLLAQN
ncbi:MAG: hypothetical protein AMJ61_07700 [Desulfobacterales bacterium SG8_35_2]|nr:MAG: hypothetical protein AMJ61_07700 [Desulfobacterales bacterium SG8_35_2]